MTNVYRTITDFLARTDLPVYLVGQIPDGAAFPYAAYSLTAAPFGESGVCEVTGWFRGGDANARCAGFLDRMAALLPEGGVLLTLPGGRLALWRRKAAQVLDGDAIGGRITIETRLYAAQEVLEC